MKKVSIVSPFFPNYRTPLFKELEGSSRYKYSFVGSSSRYLDNGVPGMNLSEVENSEVLRSRALPGGLVWQHGLLGYVMRTESSALVLTGDPHHLSTWIAAILCRLRGVTVLFWTHGWRQVEVIHKAVLRKVFYRLASDLLLYGNYAKERGVADGFKADHLHVVGNSMGAPIRLQARRTRSRNDRESRQKWIVISRLIPGRRIDAVIEGVGRLNATGRRVDLSIIGDGPMRNQLKNIAEYRGVRVDFLGAIHDLERTGDLLGQSDICLSPGHVGLAAIHALAAGCPVATHSDPERQMPEAEAVVHGLTGVRFPYRDFKAMVELSWEFVANSNPEIVAEACQAEVLRRWTPRSQAVAMEAAISASLARGYQRRWRRRSPDRRNQSTGDAN